MQLLGASVSIVNAKTPQVLYINQYVVVLKLERDQKGMFSTKYDR